MATPIITSTGSTSGAGTPGEGRNDLVTGETVTLGDDEVANVGGAYVWVFEDIPIGSATVLINATTDSPSFVPDVTGSYRVRATVDGSDFDVEVLAVPLPYTLARIPSFEEELQYDGAGNDKGWHEAMTFFMRAVDSTIAVTLQDLDEAYNEGSEIIVDAGAIRLVTDGVGVTSGAGDTLEVINTTAASNGNQQYSPLVEISGQGWETTFSASEDVRFAFQTRPVQAAVAGGHISVLFSSDGDPYAELMRINSSGQVLVDSDGTVSLPSVGWIDEANTGFYRSANTIGTTIAGTSYFAITTTGILVSVSGSEATPAIRLNDTNTGLFLAAAKTLAVSTDGTEAVRWNSTQQTLFTPGTVGAPAVSFTTDATTGIDLDGGYVCIAVGGAQTVFVGATEFFIYNVQAFEYGQDVVTGTPDWPAFSIVTADYVSVPNADYSLVNFDLTSTFQNLGAGTTSNHLGIDISATTYTAVSATHTITNAATLYVDGPPVAGANTAITNPATFWADTGLVYLDDGIEFVERAARYRMSPAGKGQVWVRSDTPNTLMFTDDAGTNWAIGGSAALVSLDQAYDYTGSGAGRTITADSSAVQIVTNSIGTGTTSALEIQNNTAAALDTQQYSPFLVFEGQGFRSVSSTGSQEVLFGMQLHTVQGVSASPTGEMFFNSNINGGGWTTLAKMSSAGQVLLNDGSESVPTLSFDNYRTSGFYTDGVGVSITASGNRAARFQYATHGVLKIFGSGTAANPNIIDAGLNTGPYWTGDGMFNISSNGVLATTWNTSQQLLVTSGSVSAPSISILGDPNTGIYAVSADSLGVTTGGTLKYAIGSSGGNATYTNLLRHVFTQSAATNSTDPVDAWRVTTGAHTSLTNAERALSTLDMSASIQFDGTADTSATTVQYMRFFQLLTPTITSQVVSSDTESFPYTTIVDQAATMYINKQPIGGTRTRLRSSASLWVDFDGDGVGSGDQGAQGILVEDIDTTSSRGMGLCMRSDAVATASTSQYAPSIVFQSQGWDNDASATEWVSAAFRMKAVEQAAGNPTVQYEWSYKHLGAEGNQFPDVLTSYTNMATLDQAGNFTAVGDLDAAGGFRRTHMTYLTGLIMSTTYTTKVNGSLTGDDALGWMLLPRSGSVVELSVWADANIAAGSAGFWVQTSSDGGDSWSDIWGSSGAPVVTLSSGGSDETTFTTQAKGTSVVAAGSLIRVRVIVSGLSAGRSLHVAVGYEC